MPLVNVADGLQAILITNSKYHNSADKRTNLALQFVHVMTMLITLFSIGGMVYE